jgi:hypothetical protein
MTIIFLDSTQKVRKVCNNSDFSQKQYFSGYVFKVSAWLSNHTVCKIGLKAKIGRKIPNYNKRIL